MCSLIETSLFMRRHRVSSRINQAGYLLEVPILFALTAILLSIFLPMLSKTAGKVLLVGGGLVGTFCLYYMIVIPGWQPNATRLRYPWNLMAFAVCALLLGFVTFYYVLYG